MHYYGYGEEGQAEAGPTTGFVWSGLVWSGQGVGWGRKALNTGRYQPTGSGILVGTGSRAECET